MRNLRMQSKKESEEEKEEVSYKGKMEGIIIRKAKKRDLRDCEKLFRAKVLRFPEEVYADKRYLQAYLTQKYFLVAEKDKKVVGSILGESLKQHHVLIWFFIIKKEFRSQGIGDKLLAEIEKIAKKDKKRWIILYSPTHPKSVLRFYKKRGFKRGHSFSEVEKVIG